MENSLRLYCWEAASLDQKALWSYVDPAEPSEQGITYPLFL
jgi:hypothetical protein